MYIIKIQLYTFRMSKTSPRSVGSRSGVFFKKIGKSMNMLQYCLDSPKVRKKMFPEKKEVFGNI